MKARRIALHTRFVSASFVAAAAAASLSRSVETSGSEIFVEILPYGLGLSDHIVLECSLSNMQTQTRAVN